MVNLYATILVVLATLGLSNCQGASKELFRCRQICYQKFVQDWHHCMDFDDCKNCWNSCDQTLGPFPLSITSASRQGSLVLTDIAWDQAVTNSSKQCLVTWEVSGGGLMGNLLTDSSTVELSLWPDTVYHVQVTCKNKKTGGMRRSFKLIVDTRKLSGTSSTLQPVAMDTSMKSLPEIFSTESLSSETEDRMKILKDSSKDINNNNNNNKENTQTTHADTVKIRTPPTVLRSKLSAVPVDSSELVTRSILFAMIGSLALFLGILIIYALTRARQDPPVDKEELIRNEVVTASANRTLHV